MTDINEYLNNYYKGSKDLSLNSMKYFMKEYNNFETQMKIIHIAGTNGKGSTVEMLTNILVKQGYKVGKFISPHLINFNERISINNNSITDKDMWKLIKELEPKINKYKKEHDAEITLFELLTIMALLYFYRNNVDFVVLETGLGGELDATNIISKPLVSVITSIGYDHMHILGNTLSEIAIKKAGIIKENSSTVFFEQEKEVNKIIIDMCEKNNNKLHLISKDKIINYEYDNKFQYFDYINYKNIPVILKGKKQIQNAMLCIETIEILKSLGYEVSEKSIKDGISTVIHKGRMEVLNEEPLIIYDGAHNTPAIKNLQSMVEMYYKHKRRIYIISILKRKDYTKMLELLIQDKDAEFIFTTGNNPIRYASSNELYEAAPKYITNQKILKMDLNQSIEYVMVNGKDTVNLIVGSFYVYGDVVKHIKINDK